MKTRTAGTILLSLVGLCAGPVFGAGEADGAALIAAAEKANAAGDKVAAVKAYTEAVGALRASKAKKAKIDACAAERDRLLPEVLETMQKQQAEILRLQREIAQRMARVAQIDAGIQERVKRNENKIKDIETILLDISK